MVQPAAPLPTHRFATIIALLVLALIGVVLSLLRKPIAEGDARGSSPDQASNYSRTIQFVPSPLERLHAPDTDARADVSALQATLTGLSQSLQGNLPPIGDDRDLAVALLGRNRDGLAFLPSDSPAYDSATGHLRDRWGTPYFVHARAPNDFEIRSAGPDKQLFTDDDVIASYGDYVPQAGTAPPPTAPR